MVVNVETELEREGEEKNVLEWCRNMRKSGVET
jgi:hypothetical protein